MKNHARLNVSAGVHGFHFLRTRRLKYAAAVIIKLGVAAYLRNINTEENARDSVRVIDRKNDVLPGGNRATLTLSGDVIHLDSAINDKGAIIREGYSIQNYSALDFLEYKATSC